MGKVNIVIRIGERFITSEVDSEDLAISLKKAGKEARKNNLRPGEVDYETMSPSFRIGPGTIFVSSHEAHATLDTALLSEKPKKIKV